MTRVGIITFLHNENYGSTLQAWALAQTVEQLGYQAAEIDYAPGGSEKLRNLLYCGNSPSLLLDAFRKRLVKANQKGAQEKAAALSAFRRQHLPMTAPCHHEAQLRHETDQCDILLSGSDQIWSPTWLNPVYFFDFAATGQPRVAYAPSLGVSALANGRKAQMIRRMAGAYTALSVREEAGAAILHRLTGRNVPVMPDPVFLISPDVWRKFATKSELTQPYLLCYFIGENPSYWLQASREAASAGFAMVIVPVTAEAWRQTGMLQGGVTPEQWVGLIDGAARLVTDSFHGAAFAYMLNTPVTVLRRYHDGHPNSRNSRIDQLNKNLGIDGDDISPERLSQRMAALRHHGYSWLKDALHQAEEQSLQAKEKKCPAVSR